MLIGIEGELGGGKTLLMVYYLIREYEENKRKIMANIRISGIPYENIDVESLLQDNIELFDVVLGIDEITLFADCRMSMSKRNLFFGYLILQSRKRNMDVYYTTQDLTMLDKRFLQHTNITVLCEKLHNASGETIDDYRMFSIFDLRSRKLNMKTFIMDISPYYSYYDTNQIITPIEIKKIKKE